VRITEVDLHTRVNLQTCVLSRLSSLIPSQRPTQLLRQGDDRVRDGVAHCLGTMSAECRSVLHTNLVAMFRHARQVQQQGEARRALHQGADCGTTKTHDEIPFPVAWHWRDRLPQPDPAYGNDSKLRAGISELGLTYVAASCPPRWSGGLAKHRCHPRPERH
jgi:hypothetical protein